MKRFWPVALVLSLFAFDADTARAAPAGIADRPIDLELREADVTNVFHLLAEVGGTKVVLDPCVHGKIDLKLKNAPVSVVFDLLATKLALQYETRDSAIFVSCRSDAGTVAPTDGPSDPRLDKYLSVSVRDADIGSVLAQVAKTADLELDVRGGVSATVTLTLNHARLSTIIAASKDATGLEVFVEGRKLVMRKPAAGN